ncbi:cilia- and flagella-associated protein 54 isoform X4 [Cygnus olor]|uniref:cilia- and flagella-associated protein 54 isoform X4 n=1 Tax=Cygnus olor TaxID=8869 RepID=UPI001ADE22E6|nr:cilia- and flagella-associated protein 54 isoform X4 [Cygnus olor]
MADAQVARHCTGSNRAALLSIPPKPLSCDANRELRNTSVPRPPPTALKEGVCSFLLEAGGHPGGLLGLPEPGLRLWGFPPAGPRRGRHVPGQSRCPRPLLGDAAAPRPGRSMAEPPPAAFYGAVAPGNPVVDSLEAELRDVLGFLRRLRGAGEAEPQRHDLHRRGANTLFNIWNKYKPRLPDWYYNDKLLKVGDSLVQIQEYKLALRQCYGRYLQQFSSVNPDDVTDDVHKFKSTFFPNGFGDKNVAFTFHALQERNVCIYQMVCSNDRNLQNQESLQTCFNVLSSLRLTMQVALPQENLCWLIYNGTIHIYTICRHLMMIGQSAKVLEYLLWASICMELSIPLLSVHYLTWRATLYAAVSQCYFDCQAGIHGEVFSRRGLIKIDELKQLENISSSQENSETKKIFREATLKMSVMIFKRAVYESRRKPKSYFRPKLRVSLKEAQNLSWPRTTTERLLTEMFDCTAAQFLAILEALSDSSRHVLRPAPPVPDEIEIRDVISELFFAGLEILSGGMSTTGIQGSHCTDNFGTINASSTLLQLILTGENGVPGDAAVKFIKLAFSYEEWDVFDSAVEFVTNFLQAQDDPRWKKAEIELKLLTLMQPLLFPRKFRCGFSVSEANTREARMPRGSDKKQTLRTLNVEGSLKYGEPSHELTILATTVFSCISTSKQNMQPDKEILFDVIMFLWQKCKTGLQQIQTSGSGYFKYIHKYKACKWVYVLWIINEVIQKSNIADMDVVMVIEVTLNLTAILENIADSTSESKKKTDKKGKRSVPLSEDETCDTPEILMKSPTEQLQFAYESLEKAINEINKFRLMTLLPDGTSIFDNCCTKVDSNGQNLNSVLGLGNDKTGTGNNFLMDLHLELIQAQHRIAVKLLKLTQGVQKDGRSLNSSNYHVKIIEDSHYLTEADIIGKIKKNKLSRAIFLMQKAAQIFPEELTTSSQKQLLEVSWYSILGCVAGGSNTKVRLNNNKLPNAGEEIPADGKSVLEIQGLDPNEKYIFAVAAYSSDGKLIGDAIGETTKPILAYPPLSATTVRAYLTQVAYQTGNYTLAREAFSPTWDYFVSNSSPLPGNTAVISARSNLTISENRLRLETVSQTSPITLYLFLRNIFAICDINVMEGGLFCDSVCSDEILYKEQAGRLAECERMTVAIDLGNWLSDASYTLQSVVQCYGLLAPIIYHKISAVPVVQILIKCLAVLQEIPSAILQRRQAGCYESIQHMIACTSFYTAKVLHSWKEYELAVIIINYGKNLLDSSQAASLCRSGAAETEETHTNKENISAKTSHLAAMEKATENLNALESNLLRLTKPVHGSELTGQEDPLFLYPIISCWTSNTAYREVMKFKNKSRFLEFFIQVLNKILNEEKVQNVLEWSGNVQAYLKRRNDHLLCINGTSRPETSSSTLPEGTRKYTRGVGEFQKSVETSALKKPEASALKKQRQETLSPIRKRQTLRQYFVKHPDIMKSPEAQRKHKEELRKVAHRTLVVLLKPIVSNYLNRKKFHQICLEEMPWRSQMNIYLAIAHYHLFKKKLEEQYNIGICGSQHQDSYNILDPEIFSLNNSGTVVVRESVENNRRTPTPFLLKKSPSGLTKKQTYTDRSSEHTSKLSGTYTPQTQMTNGMEISILQSPRECSQFSSNTILLDHFTKIFLHLRRAVVLAHRGGHWTLLQNACRELWNYTQESQSIAKHSHSHMDAFPITKEFLRNTIWLPFYLASDMIIDMITELQANDSLKIVDPEGDFCIPSCLGGITDENGGSNLHPQSPLDDVNVVDLKWICNLVLKTIELLYQMKKWEALVHIAVQFNIFTHERYTEQVIPLLVYAQRQLLERKQQFSSPDSHESHFIKYLSDNANKMSCRDYIGWNLQLPVAHAASVLVFPGCIAYPEMKNDYTGGSQAKRLVYVPLDVNDTLKCFRETLKKSKFHSRALRHSRKLLSLFLAHTQENVGRAIGQISPNRRLEFNVGAELIFLPIPHDLSQEKFNFSSMVESKPIPQSQLSVIVSSYEQTIGILEKNNQNDLKVQALHELGNLHFYAGNKRAAFKYWCQALDETLNIADALNNWQELGFPKNAKDCFAIGRSTDISQKFISQAGIWGCLLAAVLVAKIAQYITTSNMRLRTKHCYFSAILFKTLFRASLPHPTSDCDFAQYEMNMLIPGIDLFSDRYRADVSTVVASLNFLMFELHCAKHNLIILPLFTLHQYFVSEICKDPAKCIEGRIFKIKVLTDIGFFTEAFHELSLLNCGERIPWKIPSGYRKTEQMKALQRFDSSKSLLTVTNLQVLEDIFNWSLSLTMLPLCNQQIMNKLTLAKMHFIICLSATINTIPEKVEKHIYSADNEPSGVTASNVKVNADKNSRQQEQRSTMVQLVDCKDKLNMAMLKGILLTEAEESLNHLVQNIQDKYDEEISQCSVEDIEALIEAKLQLAAISQQRHQAAFSVALAFTAIRLLQDADIFRMKPMHFQEKKNDFCAEDGQLPHSTIAQDHMNMHLWLRCRKMLVTALVTQIHGIGYMEENYVAERRSVIKEVIIEAEAFGDIETQAEMMVQAAILDLQERCPMAGIKLLQDIISLLQEDTFIFSPASLTLVKSMLLLADILALQTVGDAEYCSSAMEPLNLLILAHEITIKAIFLCGESIEQQIEDSTLTCLVLPAKNIYLPHINLLAQVKMRIGRTLAEKVACTPERVDPLQWLRALKHLESALELCRESAKKELDIEAELLFQIGKVECQITKAGNNKAYLAVETLLEAIKLSQQHDQNFELIRRSYLEIALLYMHFVAHSENVSQTDKMVPSKSRALKSEGYKVQAWIAVRAARQVSEAVVASQLLIGMKSVKEKDEVQQKIPEFASMDLLASYRDFLSDGYNAVYESPTASSTENKQIIQNEQNQKERMECLATKASRKKEMITWVHLIHYHSYLQRLYNTNLLSGPESFSGRDGRLKSVFDSWIVLRIAKMHFFLKKHLFEYSVCCPENFPEELYDVELPHGSLADSSKMSLETSGILPKMPRVRIASPVSVTTEAGHQTESRAANASNKEINIQWYIPSLAKPSNNTETKVLLLYAYNTKPIKISNIKIFSSMSVFSGHLWVPLARVTSLREKLSNLKDQVEMLMQSSESLYSASEPTSFLEQNETLKIILSEKAEINIAKVHLDEKTEEMAKRCLSEVKALLSVPDLSSPLTEIPFDVTLQSISTLEDMFDPASAANGCTITEESLFRWIISLFH